MWPKNNSFNGDDGVYNYYNYNYYRQQYLKASSRLRLLNGGGTEVEVEEEEVVDNGGSVVYI